MAYRSLPVPPVPSPWRSPLVPLFSALLAACGPSPGTTSEATTSTAPTSTSDSTSSSPTSPTSSSSSSSTYDPSDSSPGQDCWYQEEVVLTPEEYEQWAMGKIPESTGGLPTSATDTDATDTDATSTSDSSTTSETSSTSDASSTSGTTGPTLDDEQICRLVCEYNATEFYGLDSCSIEMNPESYIVTCYYPATCGGRGHACVRSRGGATEPDAGAQWLARAAHDEAASVHAFRALADELGRRGAPLELLEALAEAARDEERHAARMLAWAERAGAVVAAPTIAACPDRDLRAIAVENAVEGCVLETWAALVAAHQAHHADDPELRAEFAAIAVDEARHAELAWQLDTWLLGQLDDDARAEVAAARRTAVRTLAAALAAAPDQPEVIALGVPSSRAAAQLCAGLEAALWSQAA